LYNQCQVRRMVGALLGVGKGQLQSKDILFMLQTPTEKSWNPRCAAAGSEGLFLKSVNYKDPIILRGYLS
jgi:tRNA U38,U39,U40 pseudouridine synthase TruA